MRDRTLGLTVVTLAWLAWAAPTAAQEEEPRDPRAVTRFLRGRTAAESKQRIFPRSPLPPEQPLPPAPAQIVRSKGAATQERVFRPLPPAELGVVLTGEVDGLFRARVVDPGPLIARGVGEAASDQEVWIEPLHGMLVIRLRADRSSPGTRISLQEALGNQGRVRRFLRRQNSDR